MGWARRARYTVSVLYREPKLLKAQLPFAVLPRRRVSVLYREPKLLKAAPYGLPRFALTPSFSALP